MFALVISMESALLAVYVYVCVCVCVCVCEREIVNQEPTDTGNSVNVCLRAGMGVPELVELHG